MQILRIVITCLVLLSSPSIAADDIDKHAAVKIMQTIVGTCETQGMLACEPYLKGIDTLFSYIRVYQQVSELDHELQHFIQHKYPGDTEFNYYTLYASLSLYLNVDFTTEQFTSRVQMANQVREGYDVVMDQTDGPVLKLRRADNQWIAMFPKEGEQHFSQLKTLSAAGQLKRSILVYRMLEADLAGLSKLQFEDNLNKDLAPLIVSIFGEERFPKLRDWLVQDVDSVIEFYSQFSNLDQMKQFIKEQHNI